MHGFCRDPWDSNDHILELTVYCPSSPVKSLKWEMERGSSQPFLLSDFQLRAELFTDLEQSMCKTRPIWPVGMYVSVTHRRISLAFHCISIEDEENGDPGWGLGAYIRSPGPCLQSSGNSSGRIRTRWHSLKVISRDDPRMTHLLPKKD